MFTGRRVLTGLLASVLAWVLGAAAAVAVGLLALSLINDGLATDAGRPFTSDAARRAAAAAPASPRSGPSAGPPAAPPAAAPTPAVPPGTGPGPGGKPPPDAGGTPGPGRDPGPGPDPGSRPGSGPGTGGAPAAPPPQAQRPAERIFTTSGGSAVVRCTGSQAYLVSWSPKQGYGYDNVQRGPGERVRVRFRSGGNSGGGGDDKVDLRVVCVGGVPQQRDGSG